MFIKPDKIQQTIINTNKDLLILASAGSGKTFTLIEKVNRLLKTYKSEEILIISFTNEVVNNLKKKIKDDVDIYTFHKLAISILNKTNYDYTLASDSLLKYIIDEYFNYLINEKEKKLLCRYFFEINYNLLIKKYNFKLYKRNILAFIKLYKSHNYDYSYLLKLLKTKKDSLFILLILNILNIYEQELRSTNKIDLDDLIIIASKLIKEAKLKYKYILVDEFQDTSWIRFNLVYTIYKTYNCIINIFGDDFQSIYAFSGCKLSIMLNIKDYIPNIEFITLDKNYRLSNELIKISTNFIMKNTNQINKSIYSNINIENPIEIIYFKDINKAFNKALLKAKSISDNIMILSRYKHDLEHLDTLYKKLTIHEAKGLEADIIILLNICGGYYGFPSNILNHPFIDNIQKENDRFLYAEERRLFFVAITRTKKKIFLLVPKDNPSPFIKEIKKML